MTITDTTAPPIGRDLRALTIDELAEAWQTADVDDPAVFAALLAQADQIDQADRAAKQKERRDRAERQLQSDWYDAMHAQRSAFEAEGIGYALNAEGKRRGISEWALWTGPASLVDQYGTTEIKDFFLRWPRLTLAEYKRRRHAAGRIQREEWRDRDEISERGHDDEHEHDGTAGPGLADPEAGALRHESPAPQAPQAGPGRPVRRGGPGDGGTEDSGEGQRDGRPAGPVQRPGIEARGADMGLIGTAMRIDRALERGQPQRQDGDGTANGSIPAPADCSTETTELARLTEEELQQFGQQMLEEACRFTGRFSVMPSRAATWALALFAASNWIYQAFTETPRFHISALEYGAGKTRVMELVSLLCPNPQMMAKITGPALYHIIDERHPAPLCLDEADVIFGAGQRGEELRGILNAGYKYNGTITRVSKGEAADFSVYCPAMFAGKGKLPKSLDDRSVTIMMTRRRPGQQMDRFIPKMHDAMGRKIGLMLGAWATKIQGPAGDILWDDPPETLADRQVDILTPLYAIAQMAAGPWPERFAEIVTVLVLGGVATDEVSPGTALLAAIRDVWPEDTDRLATHQLAELLAEHESGEFAWPESQRAAELNARMRDMGIPPVPMRINGTVMRGYDRASVTGGVTR